MKEHPFDWTVLDFPSSSRNHDYPRRKVLEMKRLEVSCSEKRAAP